MAPELIKKEISVIEILPEYAQGLQGIETCRYLDLVFSFHRNDTTNLIATTRTGDTKGVFATRSPDRPNHVGITTVKLIKRDGNKLYVQGADALNDSPVIDIKCCDTSFHDQENIHKTIRTDSPRIDIIRDIVSDNTEELLLKAAQMHGHICPGLALGVMGAAKVMQLIYGRQLDPQDFTLTVEMQNCLVDGIIFVTGCTPGNKRLVMDNRNQMRFTLKNKEGWIVCLKESGQKYIDKCIPATLSPAEKGFRILQLDWDELFQITDLLHVPVSRP